MRTSNLTSVPKKVKTGRAYFLPVSPLMKSEAEVLALMGADLGYVRSWEQFTGSLEKAKSGEYSSMLFPQNFVKWEHWQRAFKECQAAGLHCGIQMTPHFFLRIRSKELEIIKDYGTEIEIVVVEDQENSLDSVFQRLGDSSLVITFLVTSGLKLEELVGKLRGSRHQLYFYFPNRMGGFSQVYSVCQVQQKVAALKKKFPQLKVSPPSGLDIYEPRIEEGREMEPVLNPEFEMGVPNKNIHISVIIPSYNNRVYLSVVVKHLLQQTLPKEYFEIILVDDGSDDGTKDYFYDLKECYPDLVNLKYLFFPRQSARQMGDGQFRAAVARNLGVKHAEGQIYAFLDSDIIVPENYLSHLIELHEEYDVIQGRRLELLKLKSHSQTEYPQIDSKADTYSVDNGYWLDFLSDPTPWGEMEDGWRFVCTHSLSISSNWFKKVGWFRKTFAFYGYEDTEIGYRLWKSGAKFARNDQNVYHLYHADTRSEFKNSHARKMVLLANTAPIFYLNNLDEAVFNRLSYLFHDWFRLRLTLEPLALLFKRIFRPLWLVVFTAVVVLFKGILQFFIAILETLATPVGLWRAHALRKSSRSNLEMGVRGTVCSPSNWQGTGKPLGLVRYYYCPDGESDSYLQHIMSAANQFYDGIVFNQDLWMSPQCFEVLDLAKAKLRHVIVEVDSLLLKDDETRILVEQLALSFRIHMVLTEFDIDLIPEINRLLSFENTLAVIKLDGWKSATGFVDCLDLDLRPKIYFRSEPKRNWSDFNLSSDELYREINNLLQTFPGLTIMPEPGCRSRGELSNYEGREQVLSYLKLSSQNPQIKISVVVHVVNPIYIDKCLSHLFRQELSPDMFEVVLVIDGLDSSQVNSNLERLKESGREYNLKWLHWLGEPRSAVEFCENRREEALLYGAEECQGSVLCFWNSDIMAGENFLSDLITKHEVYDVIQSQVFEVERADISLDARSWIVDMNKSVSFLPSGVLLKSRVQSLAHGLDRSWATVGSYGFSVKRELFFWAGGFSKDYLRTGLAGQHLAYRLWAAGSQLFVNSCLSPLFYLGCREQASEQIQPQACRRFFCETFSPDVYKTFIKEVSFYPRFRASLIWFLGIPAFAFFRPFKDYFFSTMESISLSWRWANGQAGSMSGGAYLINMLLKVKCKFNGTEDFLKSNLWRLKRFFWGVKSGSSLWRYSSRVFLRWYDFIPCWKLKVAWGRLVSRIPFWKIRVYWHRMIGAIPFWRIPVMIQRVPLWRVRVFCQNLFGFIFRKASYTFRKVYYVFRYQWQKRILKVRPEMERADR